MMSAEQFQNKYKTKEEKEAALKKMSNAEIDRLINTCNNTYAKIFYKRYKKG